MIRNRGFTLVEMVIAVAVLSLIVLATLTAMRSFARIQEKVNITTGSTAELRQVGEFLRISLQQARLGSGESDRGDFYAATGELGWLAPLAGVESVAGLKRHRLFLDEESMLRIAFEGGGVDPASDGSDSYILLEGVEEFQISLRSAPEAEWLEAGESEASVIPYSVKITLSVRGREWPEIIVAPDQWRGGG